MSQLRNHNIKKQNTPNREESIKASTTNRNECSITIKRTNLSLNYFKRRGKLNLVASPKKQNSPIIRQFEGSVNMKKNSAKTTAFADHGTESNYADAAPAPTPTYLLTYVDAATPPPKDPTTLDETKRQEHYKRAKQGLLSPETHPAETHSTDERSTGNSASKSCLQTSNVMRTTTAQTNGETLKNGEAIRNLPKKTSFYDTLAAHFPSRFPARLTRRQIRISSSPEASQSNVFFGFSVVEFLITIKTSKIHSKQTKFTPWFLLL